MEHDLRSDPESVARLIALRMLERQPRTRAELEQAMRRRGVPPDAATAVLDRFSDVGLVDDAAFATAWVESRHRTRRLAGRALAAELRTKGVDAETIKTAVETIGPDDEIAAARELVRRRLPTLARHPRDAQARRLLSLLARKGFPSAVAYRVVREVLDAPGDADG